MDVAELTKLLQETALQHGQFEAIAPPHDWWDWYAPTSTLARADPLRRRPSRPPTGTWRTSST
jgi:hypothetical protein